MSLVQAHLRTRFGLAALVLALIGALSACGGDDDGNGSNNAQARAALGQQVAEKFVCQSCHGADLSGAAIAGTTPALYAPNLTPHATGLAEWSDDQIKNAVLNGTDDEGETLCNEMQRYGNSMSTADAENLVAYLKSLPAVEHEVPENSCE